MEKIETVKPRQEKKEDQNLFQSMNLLEGTTQPSATSPAKTTDLLSLDPSDTDPEMKGNDLFNNLNVSSASQAG